MSRKDYKYNVGDIINNCKVIEQIIHIDSRGSKVKCLNNNIVYESMAEAQRKTGANASQIRKSCNDSKYTAGIINGCKGKWVFVN